MALTLSSLALAFLGDRRQSAADVQLGQPFTSLLDWHGIECVDCGSTVCDGFFSAGWAQQVVNPIDYLLALSGTLASD